MTVEDKHVGER